MIKKKIVFLTGAGISAESGVQTFRDSNGLWEGHKVEEVATIDGWVKNPQKVLDFYNDRRKQLNTVGPNLSHKLIGDLEKDYDVVVVTQNIDDLHERGGSSNVIHLHGSLSFMCSSIDKSQTLPYIADIKIGDLHQDGSQIRPSVVWFGEDVDLIDDAIKEVRSADILVIVGTSLVVYPAAGLMGYAKSGCDLYYIDPNPKMQGGAAQYFTIIKKIGTEGVKELYDLLIK